MPEANNREVCTLEVLICPFIPEHIDFSEKVHIYGLGPIYMRRAGPLASWLANKPARFDMRDSKVSQPQASPAIRSHVPSSFRVKLKEQGNIF